MHALVKTAAIHNLSLATAFGGWIFAAAAVKTILREVRDEQERGKLVVDSFARFNKVNVPAHIAFTLTWLREREAIKELHAGHHVHDLVHVKDLLIAGALVTGVINAIATKKLRKEYPEGVPISLQGKTADPKLDAYHRVLRVTNPANMFFVGAALAIEPAIGARVVHHLLHRGLLHKLGLR